MKTAYIFQKGMETGEIKLEREDHFDGENTLYRLAAYIPRDSNESMDKLVEYSHFLKDILSELPVRPYRLFIHKDCYEIDWAPVGCQVLSSRAQYAQLLLNFAKFLDEDYFCNLNIQIQLGSLGDDPLESIHGISNEDINFSPTFIPECFGNEGNIEVICLDISEY